MSEFEEYRRRQLRIRELEFLLTVSKNLVNTMLAGRDTDILRAYADLREQIEKVDSCAPPHSSTTNN